MNVEFILNKQRHFNTINRVINMTRLLLKIELNKDAHRLHYIVICNSFFSI
jgi:hypothetical protein